MLGLVNEGRGRKVFVAHCLAFASNYDAVGVLEKGSAFFRKEDAVVIDLSSIVLGDTRTLLYG